MEMPDHALRRVRRGSGLCFWGAILFIVSSSASLEAGEFRLHLFYAVGGVMVFGLILLARAGLGRTFSALAIAGAATTAAFIAVLLVDGGHAAPVAIAILVPALLFHYLLLARFAHLTDQGRLYVELRYLRGFAAALALDLVVFLVAGNRAAAGPTDTDAWRMEFLGPVVRLTPTPAGVVAVGGYILAAALALACITMFLRSYWFIRDWAVLKMRSREEPPPTHQA